MHAGTNARMYVCMYARTYVCMNVLACVYVCICVCKYVSMDVCIYVCNRMYYYPCNSIRELGWPLNGLIRGITGHCEAFCCSRSNSLGKAEEGSSVFNVH